MPNKVCKQCRQSKEEDGFRVYTSRSKGIRNSRLPGRHTTCKDCEKINARLDAELKKDVVDQKIVELYKAYYKMTPGTLPAIARRLLQLEEPVDSRVREDDALSLVRKALDAGTNINKLGDFMMRVRNRDFDDSDAAFEALRELREEFGDVPEYADAEGMIADWEEETW